MSKEKGKKKEKEAAIFSLGVSFSILLLLYPEFLALKTMTCHSNIRGGSMPVFNFHSFYKTLNLSN